MCSGSRTEGGPARTIHGGEKSGVQPPVAATSATAATSAATPGPATVAGAPSATGKGLFKWRFLLFSSFCDARI